MKHCPTCGGTETALTPEARRWLSASGAEQAVLPKPEPHDRFVPCPACTQKGVKLDAYEVLEEGAGHRLTMVGPLMAGRSPYYCERCGAFVLIESGGGLLLFHVPPGSPSTQELCAGRILPDSEHPLRDRLADLDRRDNALLGACES